MKINPGKVLVIVAAVLFCLIAITSLVIGSRLFALGFGYGMLALIIGAVVSAAICLPIYALGYMICIVKENRDLTEDLLICIAEKES